MEAPSLNPPCPSPSFTAHLRELEGLSLCGRPFLQPEHLCRRSQACPENGSSCGSSRLGQRQMLTAQGFILLLALGHCPSHQQESDRQSGLWTIVRAEVPGLAGHTHDSPCWPEVLITQLLDPGLQERTVGSWGGGGLNEIQPQRKLGQRCGSRVWGWKLLGPQEWDLQGMGPGKAGAAWNPICSQSASGACWEAVWGQVGGCPYLSVVAALRGWSYNQGCIPGSIPTTTPAELHLPPLSLQRAPMAGHCPSTGFHLGAHPGFIC